MQTKHKHYLAELSTRTLLDKILPEDWKYFSFCFSGMAAASSPNSKMFNAESFL